MNAMEFIVEISPYENVGGVEEGGNWRSEKQSLNKLQMDKLDDPRSRSVCFCGATKGSLWGVLWKPLSLG